MIISAIKIENISSFKGVHVFKFNHTPRNTIAVVFGENGSGKTSILQALKIGLYGQFLFNNNKNNYQTYLNSFIRRNEHSATVELCFQLRTLSGVEKYTIRRGWQRSNASFKERLSVLKGSEQFKELSPQFYQEFIFNIVPIGMMELFFFDGEKINNLGASLSFGEISSAVKRLIGITAIDALEDAVRKSQLEDLQGTSGYELLQRALKELEVRLAKLHKEGEQLHQQCAETNDSIKKCKALLGNKEITFFETGGNLASSREVLKEKKKFLQQQIEKAQSQIREASQEYLPLCVLSEELKELSDQLITERDGAVKFSIKEYAQGKNKQLEQILIAVGASKDVIKAALSVLVIPDEPIGRPIHGLSTKQTDEILAIISMVNDVFRTQALEAFSELNANRHELDTIESALEKIPDNAELAEALSVMKDINIHLARHEKHLEDILTQKKRIENEVDALKNKKNILLQQVEKQGAVNKSDDLAKRFPQVLNRIKANLFERRLQTLQRLILHNIEALFRKNQLISDVRITSDFSVELIGKDAAFIDFKCLSAGEQQMLATAIQWALATLANGSIPTIIDTPLARLDSHHRKSLAQNYYPMMNQLILLSTDEEIDNTLLQEFKLNISDIYSLKYNKTEECTEVIKVDAQDVFQVA
jgi:DNA sulfur modification protein DndD